MTAIAGRLGERPRVDRLQPRREQPKELCLDSARPPRYDFGRQPFTIGERPGLLQGDHMPKIPDSEFVQRQERVRDIWPQTACW